MFVGDRTTASPSLAGVAAVAYPYGAFAIILRQNRTLITSSLRKMYYKVQVLVIFKPQPIL